MNTATPQRKQSLRLKMVEHPAYIEPGVANFKGQLFHKNEEILFSSRIDGMIDEKAHDALLQRARSSVPRLARDALGIGRKDVQEVQPDDQEIIEQSQHLVFGERDEMGFRQRAHSVHVACVIPKERIGLQKPGSLQLLDYTIAMIVGSGLKAKRTANQETKPLHIFACPHHDFSRSHFLKAKAGITSQLHQLGTAHSLKKRELEKLLVYSQLSIINCQLPTLPNAIRPAVPARRYR